MQELFFFRFFSTQRNVSIADLACRRQGPNEPVQDFILRWRQEANKCRAHLSEAESVKICRCGIKMEIALPINEQITTFRDLATEAASVERGPVSVVSGDFQFKENLPRHARLDY